MSKRHGVGIKNMEMSGDKKNEFGCIVTFSNRESKHFSGEKYLEQAAAHADRRETKIVTISTPNTIYRDMQGTRWPIIEVERRTQSMMFVPEKRMLSHIKRPDLYSERILLP